MPGLISAVALATLLLLSPLLTARDDGLAFHEDYYLGFSQGVYYGLLLAGTGYEAAWCVKGELAYEAADMGTGGEFQAKLERIFQTCSTQQ